MNTISKEAKMSHFTVLVVGEDIEKQLAPFHEFECTGTNDEYVLDVDVTEESVDYGTDKETGVFNLEEALGYHGLEDKIVADESEVDREDAHKYGYAVVQEGKLIKAVNRTNPNKEWDWWVVGGRWNKMFQLKPGCSGLVNDRDSLIESTDRADIALKKEIDFEAMRDADGEKAAVKYDKAVTIMGDSVSRFTSWDEIRDVLCKGDIDKARTIYNEQEAIKLLRADDKFKWDTSPSEFACTREEYIQLARNSAGVTFAVLKDGKWHERGSMGWWGCVSDEKDKGAWNREFTALIDSLPADTQLAVVDCHI
jgi:hypothetical protein